MRLGGLRSAGAPCLVLTLTLALFLGLGLTSLVEGDIQRALS